MNGTAKKAFSLKEMILKNEVNIQVGLMDVLYGLFCYIMWACELFHGRTPFSLSVYSASFSKGKWRSLMIVSIIGAIYFRRDFSLVIYIMALVLFTVTMNLLSAKTNLKAVCMGFSLFASYFVRNLAIGFLWETFFLDLIESVFCGLCVTVFLKAVPLFANSRERNCIFDTEIICIFISLALTIRAMSSLPLVFGIDLSQMASILVILIVNLQGDIFSGSAAGAAFGLVTYGSGVGITSSVGAYALASLSSAILRRFGKWGVVLGFVIANTAMVSFFDGEALPFDIFEIITASIILACLPNRVTSFLSNFSAKTVHSVTKEYLEQTKVQKIIKERLLNLSRSYKNLSSSYDRCFENKNMSKEYIIRMIDTASSKVCPDCGLKYNCWERGYKESYKSMLALLEKAEEKGEVKIDDVPEVMKQKCVKPNELLSAFNGMYSVYKVDKLWQQRLNESRRLVSFQLDGVSRSVEKLALEFDMCIDIAAEKELKASLDAGGIDFEDITFLKSEGNDFFVDVVLNQSKLSQKEENKISQIIAEITGEKVSKTSFGYHPTGSIITFRPAKKYSISIGKSSLARDGEKTSGDSLIITENSYGETVVAISDGMGTGEKAAKESSNATSLLKNFMSAGMDMETSLELINSALLLSTSGESFATMDVCAVNLTDGCIKFSKSGAAPGYIKTEYGMSKIYSDALPFGVLGDYGKINKETYYIDKYALIVMMSDGVEEAFYNEKKDVIKEMIDDEKNTNPQLVASSFMKKALEQYDNKPTDDMTIVVMEIRKNEE